MDFGADPTGVADSTAAIQNAAATGKNVYLPPGYYLIASSITVNNQISIIGAGKGLTTFIVSGSGYDAFVFTSSYSGIFNASFNTPTGTPRTSGGFVTFNSATRSNWAKNLLCSAGYYNISVIGATVITEISDIEINTMASGGVGVFIAGGNDTYLNKIVMQGTLASQPLAGIYIRNTGAVWATDCDMISTGKGVYVSPSISGDAVTWCFFEQVACDTCSGNGISIEPASGFSVRGFNFVNCWTATCGTSTSTVAHGVHLGGAGTIDGIVLDSHRSLNNSGHGVNVTNGSNFSLVGGSVVTGNSEGSTGTYHGVYIAPGISNFQIKDSILQPALSFGNTQGYGLYIGNGTSTDFEIDGNITNGAINPGTGIYNGATGASQVFGQNTGYNWVANSGNFSAPTVAGSTQAGAVAITTASVNLQAGSAGLGAILPATAPITSQVSILNGSSYQINLYPPTGGNIVYNGILFGTNLPIVLSPFTPYTANFVEAANLWSVSGGVTGSAMPVTATGSTTARTLADRAADVINVKDFGAKGDGVNLDAPAFNAAIAYLAANGGGALYVPNGQYNLTSPFITSGGDKIPLSPCRRWRSILRTSQSASLAKATSGRSLHPFRLAGPFYFPKPSPAQRMAFSHPSLDTVLRRLPPSCGRQLPLKSKT